MNTSFLISAFHERQYPPPDRPEVAFAGRSNVGKSSLINVLVNRKGIARTSSTPGRTQSINFFSVDERLYMVDLPGYGYARVSLKVRESWRQMVETYLRTRMNLAAVVVILDIRREPGRADLDLLQWLKAYGKTPILVLTKVDKVSRSQRLSRSTSIAKGLEGMVPERPVLFSARTREGKEEIWKRIGLLTGTAGNDLV